MELLDGGLTSTAVQDIFRYEPGWGVPGEPQLKELHAVLAAGPPQ